MSASPLGGVKFTVPSGKARVHGGGGTNCSSGPNHGLTVLVNNGYNWIRTALNHEASRPYTKVANMTEENCSLARVTIRSYVC